MGPELHDSFADKNHLLKMLRKKKIRRLCGHWFCVAVTGVAGVAVVAGIVVNAAAVDAAAVKKQSNIGL